jgi:hypothetical protein
MAKNLNSYNDVKAAVEAAGGVLTLEMGVLREINGSGRLGPYVIDAISRELAGKGLGHEPSPLPQLQYEPVRLFQLGSPIAEIHSLVKDVNKDNDEKLREFGSGEAVKKLNAIRQIVCFLA